jgi:hypothetical protein
MESFAATAYEVSQALARIQRCCHLPQDVGAGGRRERGRGSSHASGRDTLPVRRVVPVRQFDDYKYAVSSLSDLADDTIRVSWRN